MSDALNAWRFEVAERLGDGVGAAGGHESGGGFAREGLLGDGGGEPLRRVGAEVFEMAVDGAEQVVADDLGAGEAEPRALAAGRDRGGRR